ncbi:MAG: aminotransferase class III-fold pyridoxal phosphate-dependent enzyme, partial [SAR324 cluster bacterium]|nr:aminotransferase class III-fold pyridoxal phosphate-dependent enzyme [SAR324 cluster bacterium]
MMVSEIKEILHEVTGIPVLEIKEEVDLFALGVDSLMMSEAKQKIESSLGIEISLEDFFEETPTVKRMAALAENELGGKSSPLNSAENTAADPSNILQERLLTLPGNSAEGESFLEKMIILQNETMRQQLDFMSQQLEIAKSLPSEALQETINKPLQPALHPREKKTPNKAQNASFDSVQYTGFRSLKFTKDDNLSLEQQQFIKDFIIAYTGKTPKSKNYSVKHRGGLSDWINTLGFRLSLKEVNYPIVAARSEGTRFWDIDGNEYLDIAMGYGVSFFGHRPPFIIEALEAQMKEGFELAPQSDLSGKVANLIRELTGVERVTFCNTGSEAVMVALRIARTVTQRKKIVLFSGAYHGIYDGVLAVSGEDGAIPIAPGILPEMVENVIVLSYNTPKALSEIQKYGDELAAILVEPVQSRQPHVQPKAFLEELRKLATESGAALIFDEMITGFRSHPGGAQAHFGVTADIVTYGKAVGGGMPIGILAGKARFINAIDGGGDWVYGDDSFPNNEATFFGGTFCKHPLSLASAHAALVYMKEQGPDLQKGVNQKTTYFAKTINAFFKEQKIPLQVTYFASQFRFEGSGKYHFLLKPLEVDLFFFLLMHKGIYTWEKRICFFSTVHTDEDVELVIKAIQEVIREMKAVGFFFEPSTAVAKKKGKLLRHR